MYTSFGILSLAGLLWSSAPASPTPGPDPVWWRDYYVARDRGATEQKPLAVFVGKGLGGYQQLTREGVLDATIKKVLADHYVCVYLDAGFRSQEGLIKALAVTKGNGLVLSDKTGNLQAFHYDGQIAASELARQLEYFAQPTVEVRATVSNTTPRVSYYPTGSFTPRQPAYAPAVYAAFSGRSC
jgi:hypothetical protein